MQPESPTPPDEQPAKGLPPVRPPSGSHIVQLFVVPGVIVAIVVVLLLGCTGVWNWILGISSSSADNLAQLESPNMDVRWRAAERLAQVLKRDDQLASDPKFGLKLTELLSQELDDLDKHDPSL